MVDEVLLASQKAMLVRLLQEGSDFKLPDAKNALSYITQKKSVF